MKHIFVLATYLLLAAGVQAQPNPEKREERLQTFRIAIFTEVLNLTPEEAQQFWPLYNDYQEKRDRVQDDLKPKKQLDAMSDAEVEEQIKRHFEMRQRELDLEKDLYQKLQKVLPARKIAKLPNAERQFRERLLHKMQENQAKREERMERRQGRKNR